MDRVIPSVDCISITPVLRLVQAFLEVLEVAEILKMLALSTLIYVEETM